MSWAKFADMIMDKKGLRCRVIPVTTEEYPTPARRPHNSRMSMEKLKQSGIAPMPAIEDALDRYLLEMEREV